MDETIRHVLTAYRTWAVVGCSPDPWRDSHSIAALLLDRGYDVVPITPKADEVLGHKAYPTLQDAGLAVVMDRCPRLELPRL